MSKKAILLCLFFLLFASVSVAHAGNYLQRFQDRVTEFSLDNGMRFLVIERHQAPVASFVTFVDAGSVNESRGKTGVAHLLEHMAFKGTPEIGTSDWSREKPLLKKMQRLYSRIRREESRTEPDRDRLSELRDRLDELRERAGEFVRSNEFSRIIEQEGGVDLNAATSADYTMYQCSLPANKAELWFYLESRRLAHPVWREFFTEKQVVLEERRGRLESDPMGRLFQELTAVAYSAHPYRDPTIGWMSDLKSLGMEDMQSFYERFYRPGNITVAVAGDLDPERMRGMAERFFGSLPAGEPPEESVTREPEQSGLKRFEVTTVNQPAYVRAYHTVARSHPDTAALDVLARILSRGRTSRLYRELVLEGLASSVQAMNGYPGDKFPSLFLVFAIPNQGTGLDELDEKIDRELDRLRSQGVESQELKRAKKNIRADLIRGLDYNLGLAKSFVQAEAQLGDWREVFTYLERVDEVTAQDVEEALSEYLRRDNMTLGELVQEESSQGER